MEKSDGIGEKARPALCITMKLPAITQFLLTVAAGHYIVKLLGAEESESAVQHPAEKRGKKIGRLPLLLVQPDTHHAESAVGQKVIDIRKLRFTVAAGEHFARAFL